MRISRGRLLLRITMLLVAAGFMAWKAWEARTGSRAPGLDPGSALLLHRVALVEVLLAVLAIGTAVAAALALRTRSHRKLLKLGDGPRGEPADPPPGPPPQ